MGRVAVWILNAALGLLGLYLLAGLANAWIGTWIEEDPAASAAAPAPTAATERTWSDRQVILQRNLFNVSTLLPERALPDEQEELEATKLPLRLLGTVASTDAGRAWAAVEDQQSRKVMVVHPGDSLLDRATVVRVERRRIVLQNGPNREELALEEDEAGDKVRPAVARAPAAGRGAFRRAAANPQVADLRERVRQLSENRFEVERGGVETAMRNPAALFSQARILPKYEDGAMLGIQVSGIQAGSLFEEIGLREGDVVTSVNGIVVASPQDSAALLKELSEASEFTVNVRGSDGATRVLNYVVGSE